MKCEVFCIDNFITEHRYDSIMKFKLLEDIELSYKLLKMSTIRR